MENIIYTLGHSNRSIEEFVAILKKHRVTHVVDARTFPFSKYSPQYTRFSFKKSLENNGIKYLYRGRSIGGRGSNEGQDGVLDWLAQSAKNGTRIALCCAEKSPRDCHLCSVIAPLLESRGALVEHLVSMSETEMHRSAKQEKLFGK